VDSDVHAWFSGECNPLILQTLPGRLKARCVLGKRRRLGIGKLEKASRKMDTLEGTNNKIHGSAALDPHERRRDARYPFTAAVEAVELRSQTRIQGRTTDLSRGGCFIDTLTTFQPGSIVKMRLVKEKRSFETRAKVIYSLADMGMGVKFTDADPEQLWILEKWVEELGGELLPEPELHLPSDRSYSHGRPGHEEFQVLNELVMELMGQRVLSSAKCEAMLEKLRRTGRAKSDSAHA